VSESPVPEEFSGLTPQLVVGDAAAAVSFYGEAFGADELLRVHGPDGRVMHCELLVAGSRLLLHDEYPESGLAAPPGGGNSVVLHLYVPDVDASFRRAVRAGAEPVMEPADAFWGDRYGVVRDPFGHRWSLASRREDLSPDELGERARQWAANPPDLSGA
jgi:PhnB protein